MPSSAQGRAQRGQVSESAWCLAVPKSPHCRTVRMGRVTRASTALCRPDDQPCVARLWQLWPAVGGEAAGTLGPAERHSAPLPITSRRGPVTCGETGPLEALEELLEHGAFQVGGPAIRTDNRTWSEASPRLHRVAVHSQTVLGQQSAPKASGFQNAFYPSYTYTSAGQARAVPSWSSRVEAPGSWGQCIATGSRGARAVGANMLGVTGLSLLAARDLQIQKGHPFRGAPSSSLRGTTRSTA